MIRSGTRTCIRTTSHRLARDTGVVDTTRIFMGARSPAPSSSSMLRAASSFPRERSVTEATPESLHATSRPKALLDVEARHQTRVEARHELGRAGGGTPPHPEGTRVGVQELAAGRCRGAHGENTAVFGRRLTTVHDQGPTTPDSRLLNKPDFEHLWPILPGDVEGVGIGIVRDAVQYVDTACFLSCE